MIIVKASKGDIICKCKGQVMIDAEMTYTLPLGIGFHGDGHCYIDSVRYKGWKGVCLECGKEVLGYTSKRIVSKKVKGTWH